jgi:hypothetical protein
MVVEYWKRPYFQHKERIRGSGKLLSIKFRHSMNAKSTIQCPQCGFKKEETMPTNACTYFYTCTHCHQLLKPKPGDCCVFCSYGSQQCPFKQKENQLNDVFTGVIIEESLEQKDIFEKVRIVKTEVEEVTEKHQTPWLKQWTLHAVEIPADRAEDLAVTLSKALDSQHAWYADYKNDQLHYIIFREKVFKIDRTNKTQYDEAKQYGLSLGIPEYQVDFHPDVKQWER